MLLNEEADRTRWHKHNFIALLNAIEFLKKQIEPFNSYTLIYTPLIARLSFTHIGVVCVKPQTGLIFKQLRQPYVNVQSQNSEKPLILNRSEILGNNLLTVTSNDLQTKVQVPSSIH